MAEKRNLGRHRKRFMVRLGSGESAFKSFTEDISTTGIFIKTAKISSPGSVIRVELALDDRRLVVFEARVMWAKKVPPQLVRLTRKAGMGVKIVRFVSGEADYRELCEELSLPYAEVL